MRRGAFKPLGSATVDRRKTTCVMFAAGDPKGFSRRAEVKL
jgi:hypothetical protein